ncbi:MAG: transketolase [Candidatus Omnitrophota bacterium]|nr:transketolase [Candidatus Omnitrophota bacterium]
MNEKNFLKKKANEIRDQVIEISVKNKAGHIAPSLSCVDILVALYYDVMSYKPEDPLWEERDRLVFSKGHGCYALYAILADKGIMPKEEWKEFYTASSALSGCIERRPEYGLEASCGSLGHGLPISVGIAFGAKLLGKSYHTFCVMGDGELQEGTTWEALQFAVKHNVGNLTVIIDSNKLRAMDFIVNVLDKKSNDKIRKLKGFDLDPVVCQGHDTEKLAKVLRKARQSKETRPNVIIAETVKGCGLKCMENVPKFHFRIPTDEELSMGKSYE